jgi:hypothetical protein
MILGDKPLISEVVLSQRCRKSGSQLQRLWAATQHHVLHQLCDWTKGALAIQSCVVSAMKRQGEERQCEKGSSSTTGDESADEKYQRKAVKKRGGGQERENVNLILALIPYYE